MRPIFITGIGTDIGKTVVSAIITQALHTSYWKPIQAGFEVGTDAQVVGSLTNGQVKILPEVYKLKMPASPHIAAVAENVEINIKTIHKKYLTIKSNNLIVIEGAGGLMVPLNEHETVADLIQALDAIVILVSRNYLGSINHSLLTAAVCKSKNIPIVGWVFTDTYLNYEEDIVRRTDIPFICTIPFAHNINHAFVLAQAALIKDKLKALIIAHQ